MPYINTTTLMGYLTADLELRSVQGGSTVASFTLGITSGGFEGRPKRAAFFDCEVWGGWAQILCKSARKGSLVLVEGRLAQDRWVDKETEKNRSRIKVVAEKAFHLLTPQREDDGEAFPEGGVPARNGERGERE